MAITIKRPAKAQKPAGLLGYDQFQMAYVTNDLERAIEVFRSSYNVQNWTVFDAHVMRIALAWTNGQQIELIHTGTQFQPLYDNWIDKKGAFTIRHHHLGYFIYDDAEWALLNEQLKAAGRKPVFEADTDMLKVIYIDAPEMGHYLEYIFPNEQGKAFFESVASN